ncbi:hypothetical protein M0802_014124 [Mischocyttarus mexicanus]|nr:hypothetical protein M0802_014124 [Mischocyttarus mexicanus]
MENIGKTGNIVFTLLKPYLGKGHTPYVDNYYSSPALFNLLYANATNACGTVTRRRKGMPVMNRKLEKGEVDFRTSDNLLALKWRVKRDVLMLSTFYTSELVSTEKRNYRTQEIICKPKCIVDYNSSMDAVDKCDMGISSIKFIRKTVKWYKKYFFHLLDIAIWNSYCLYKYKKIEDIPIAIFQLESIREILRKYHTPDVRQSDPKSADKYPLRLTARHLPAPYTSQKTKRQSGLRKCVVCTKNGVTRQSNYQYFPKLNHYLNYISPKYQALYILKQELASDKAMIPFRGLISYRTYNPAKITKYGILIRMLCESESGYICNFEIYSGQGKKLQETILSILKSYLGCWHHRYQDYYYNSVSTAELLFRKTILVCGTIRENRGLPKVLLEKS